MYSVSDTTRALVDSLAPVALKLSLYEGEDISAEVTSCTMTQRCCAGDSFTIGNACSGSLKLTMDSSVALGLKGKLVQLLWSVNAAFYPMFTGYVTRERVVNGALELEVNDALYCFGSTAFDYSTSSWTGAVNYIAGALGVGISTLATPGKAAVDFGDLPENATCAQVLAMLAGLSGGNAFIDREGLLTIRAYAETDFSAECYEDGETVEGASFATSGLKFIRPSEDENGGYLELEYSAGDGALALENPLADQSHTDYAWSKISTLNFYAGDFTIPGGLLLEPCDLITVNGNPAAVMELTMTIDGGVKTDVSSYGGEDTGGASGSLTNRVDALKERMESIQKQVTTEKTAREEAVEDLNKALADASGLYATAATQSDGSTIWYLHDQAALTASTLVVKVTGEGIGVSNDGGATYTSGFTFDGDAILKELYAEGIYGVKIVGETGSIGGFAMTENTLSTTFRRDFTVYTQTEINAIRDKLVQVMAGNATWTEQEITEYDMNMDGLVNSVDLLVMQKMLNGTESTYSEGTITIDSTNPSACIKIEVTGGYRSGETVTLGMGGVRASAINGGSFSCGENKGISTTVPAGSDLTITGGIVTGSSSFPGKLLWSGGLYMGAGQTATLSENVSDQRNGIVLVFSSYDVENSTANDYGYSYHFIPKYQATLLSGKGHSFILTDTGTLSYISVKYLYISDNAISGNANNTAIGTSNGVTYANNRQVLRYVIGV